MFSKGLATTAPPHLRRSRATTRRRIARPRWRQWLAMLALIAAVAAAVAAIVGKPTVADPLPSDNAQPVMPAEERWSPADVQDLIAAIEDSAKEGLNPADYRIDALRTALDSGRKGAALDGLARASALSLAHDYAAGRIEDKAALDWHFAPAVDTNRLATELDTALDGHQIPAWLSGLLPRHPQYRALREAYAVAGTTDIMLRMRLRANLERWRWMPRTLGDRYLLVNIPSYRLELVDSGITMASHNVIVGARRTPTPQLALHAQAIVANPGWTLPQSVIREGGWQNKGFRVTRRADGSLSVWQPPGPLNALGRIKIDMPNPHAIFLHDTPYQVSFSRRDRALSHGCVRVQNIRDLVALLHDSAALDAALTTPDVTKTLQLEKSIPVYIVYFTAQADPDGTIRQFADPYDRDRPLIAQLDPRAAGAPPMTAR